MLKMRRINNNDEIINYARNFSILNTTRLKVPQDNLLFKQLFQGNNKKVKRVSRKSMQMKVHKEKFTALGNHPQHHKTMFITNNSQPQNHVLNKDNLKLSSTYQKIASIYLKLQQLYKQNQVKLSSIFNKHIKQQFYIYEKQLQMIIRCARLHTKLSEKILHHAHPQKLLHEMSKFHQFLEQFYQQKCLKNIQITEQSILQRQIAIRNGTGKDKYKMITKSFRPKLITNETDIVEEFKILNADNHKRLDRVQCEVFKRLRSSDGKVGNVFEAVCQEKENDLFQGRKIGNFMVKNKEF